MEYFNKLKSVFTYKIIPLIIFFSVFFSLYPVNLLAQSLNQKNPIDLKISAVVQNNTRQNTRLESVDKWVYDSELSLDDAIRYNWKGVDLNLKYKTKPAKDGGYINVYLDSVSPENLLTGAGLDNYPLKLNAIASRLKPGSNTLLFSYVNSLTKAEYLPVTFVFNFKNVSSNPSIEVIKPGAKAVFMKDVEQDIQIQIKNFRLSNTPTRDSNVGKLMVYANEVKQANFLGKFSTGRELPTGVFEVNFNSKELDFSRVADNENSKLIFVLTDTNEKILPYSSSLDIITNYQNTLNVGLPRVTIVEPKKDRTDQTVSPDDKFIVQLENFELYTERQITTSPNPSPNKGYLQITVINGDSSKPLAPVWPKTEFTLNEIGYNSKVEGQRTIKVHLTNINFEVLKPEAKDTISVIYQPNIVVEDNQNTVVQSDTWRLVLIGMTIILIVGGISVLITRG